MKRSPVQTKKKTGVAAALLKWYAAHHRKLPWRAAPGKLADPYHELLSEFMLQQTQVATVIDYFHRFIAALPTLGSLAAADEQQVLRLWQGLGYYRRARHLHRAARMIQERFAGRVPATVDELLELPGVGRYTAGAIASIAHGTPAPILDGNVIRVLARLHAIDQPADSPAVKQRLWREAGRLVEGQEHPGDLNQSLMELGAMICTPRAPQCLVCPLRQMCEAAAGEPQRYPRKGRRMKPRQVTHHILSIQRGDRWLWQKRGDKGLWAGMWQQPTIENAKDEKSPGEPRLGLRIGRPVEAGRFAHQTTHRRIRFIVWRARCLAGRLSAGAGRWRTVHELEDLPLPNPQRRAVRMLLQMREERR